MKRKRISVDSYHFEEELFKISNAPIEDVSINDNLKKRLVQVLTNELNKNQLELINMYYYEHRTMKEIAQLLGKDQSTISRTIKRARDKVSRFLKYLV